LGFPITTETHQFRVTSSTSARLTVVSKRAVRGDMDVLLLAVRDQLILRKKWVRFDLVDDLHLMFNKTCL